MWRSRTHRLGCALLMFISAAARAATTPEDRDFGSALRGFQDAWYERAASEFEAFVRNYPESSRVPEAVLLQARALLEQEKRKPPAVRALQPVVALIEPRLAGAGRWADQYYATLAEASFETGDFARAAQTYATLIEKTPQSPLILEAGYGMALAHYRLGDRARAIELLRDPQGVFRRAAGSRPGDDLVVRGALVLAEALVESQAYEAAQETLDALARGALRDELQWRHWLLRARVELARRRPDQALLTTSNLLAATTVQRDMAWQAAAWNLQGAIHDQMRQPELALQAYTNTLAEPLAGLQPHQRQALSQLTRLDLGVEALEHLLPWLEQLRARPLAAPLGEYIHLALGELNLRLYLALRGQRPTEAPDPALTNRLGLAKGQFETVLANSTNAPLLAKAALGRGWCLWELGRPADSLVDFQAATKQLPPSEDRMRARFKWADAQFHQSDYAGAVTNYQAAIEESRHFGTGTNDAVPRALYQIVLASSRTGDHSSATNALNQILRSYPQSALSDRSVLLAGQVLAEQKKPAEARAMLQRFASSFTNSPLLAEVHLSLARTYSQEQDWPAAFREYDQWIQRHGDHPARVEAEFDRAWLSTRTGSETNALVLFTNLVARFPNHPLAAYAHQWIGDHYMRAGLYDQAEIEFQRLYQNTNWPPSDLTYRARLAAGRAAMARLSFATARDYFSWIITNGPPAVEASTIPLPVMAEAYFALGDAFLEEPNTNALANFQDGLAAFSKLPQNYPASPLVPAAMVRMGNCHLQLATRFPASYESAAKLYREVMQSPIADASTRSAAAVGLGVVYEKTGGARAGPERDQLLRDAIEEFLNVLYGKNLRERETADPAWVAKAGFEAARVAEALALWDQAARVYTRLGELFPAMRAALEPKLQNARQHLPRASR
jgi:tetratricopeptide (TPR) repeat protein